MGKLNEVWGDLIKDAKNYDAIIHGCNCFNVMGAGIAAQVQKVFPEAYKVDQETTAGDESKLGSFTSARISKYNLTVINAYTQYYPGANANYTAIEMALVKINENFKGKKVAIPMIGAGIAGGDWSIIKAIIIKTLTDVNLTIVYWEGEKRKFNGEFPS